MTRAELGPILERAMIETMKELKAANDKTKTRLEQDGGRFDPVTALVTDLVGGMGAAIFGRHIAAILLKEDDRNVKAQRRSRSRA
jgi:hypothetical protein